VTRVQFQPRRGDQNVAHRASRGLQMGIAEIAPEGRKRNSYAPPGLNALLRTHPRLAPWATFWSPLRGFNCVNCIVALLIVGGCSSDHRTIPNYREVEPGVLYRGAAPSHGDLKALQEHGIRTVVDLRYENTGEEPEQVVELGMRYVSIPCHPDRPSDEQMVRVLAVMTCRNCQPVFVHCMLGKDRCGTAVGVYRVAVQEWSTQDAIREVQNFQGPVRAAWYWQIPRYLGKFNTEALTERAAAMGCPACGSKHSSENENDKGIAHGKQATGS